MAWHNASTKLLHNLIRARFFIETVPSYVSGLETFANRYTAGIIGCHLMELWVEDYPNGIGLYIGILFMLLAFDRWEQTKNK